MRMKHVRLGKEMKVTDAVTFLASDRVQVEEAYPGDIIGFHNHGTIQIGEMRRRSLTFGVASAIAPLLLVPDETRIEALRCENRGHDDSGERHGS